MTERIYRTAAQTPIPAQLPEVLAGESGVTEAGWHSVEAYMRCPKEYQLRHIRQIREPARATADALGVGLCFHAGRARWFARHFDTTEKTWQSIREAVELEADAAKLPVREEAVNRSLHYLTEYVEHYSKRPRPVPILTEYKLGPAPLKQGDPFFLFRTCRLDDASKYAEAQMKLCLGEAKTTSDSIAATVQQYELHGQTLLQFVLWHMAPNGFAKYGPIQGIMLDICKKGYGKEKSQFARALVPIPSFAYTWYIDSMRSYLRDIGAVTWDTKLRRNSSQCTRYYGRKRANCEFKELCRFGKSAAIKYVMGEKGTSLLRFVPDDERTVMPWD